ncbi:hypothetical protein [Streptomyces chartreusis]|uniref:hypothetical protein n=1 Tax=Streptomyces chartreusis TaxID=1969 RepID=UPI002F90FF59|nr:hypothetical protein OG938_48665 [Streptomyces chartreusis]
MTRSIRRQPLAWAAVVSLTLAAAGCSSDDSPEHTETPRSSASGNTSPSAQQEQDAAPLAEIKGSRGLTLTLTAAERDSGGFLTISGELTNSTDERVVVPAQIRGNELEIVRNGQSLGGATLTDPQGKKIYYVLRDTEGRPLATKGLTLLKAHEVVPVYMQFPAPPASTSEVKFELPTFAPATIRISG